MLALGTYLSLFFYVAYQFFVRNVSERNKVIFELYVQLGSHHIASGQKHRPSTVYCMPTAAPILVYKNPTRCFGDATCCRRTRFCIMQYQFNTITIYAASCVPTVRDAPNGWLHFRFCVNRILHVNVYSSLYDLLLRDYEKGL